MWYMLTCYFGYEAELVHTQECHETPVQLHGFQPFEPVAYTSWDEEVSQQTKFEMFDAAARKICQQGVKDLTDLYHGLLNHVMTVGPTVSYRLRKALAEPPKGGIMPENWIKDCPYCRLDILSQAVNALTKEQFVNLVNNKHKINQLLLGFEALNPSALFLARLLGGDQAAVELVYDAMMGLGSFLQSKFAPDIAQHRIARQFLGISM